MNSYGSTSYIFCFPCSESLHGPCCAVKRLMICQELKEKEKYFEQPCRKGKMTFLTFVCPSCSARPVWLFHHPIARLCAKIGALDPSNDRKRHNEILYVAGVSTMLQMIFSLIGTFPFLISWFLGY